MVLILLALGLGVALTAYELSPRARARIDDYARALREAHAAHRAADAHLDNASVATAVAVRHAQAATAARQGAPPAPPTPTPSAQAAPSTQDLADAHAEASQTAADVASDHVAVATEQNQAAAQNTADAARNATTEAERKAAADSAARVLEREKKIAAALASLGIGQCGVRSFAHVNNRVKDTLLTKLHAEGMAVTGDNPWNIDTHQYDVKLRAVWDPKGQVLKLIVTAGRGGYLGLVTCDEIWKKIDPIMKGVIGS